MSNENLKKNLIPFGVLLLVSCLCCSIVTAGGCCVLSGSSIFSFESPPQDSSDDIVQTTDINDKSEKIPLETFEIVNQSNLTQSESDALLQSAFSDNQFIQDVYWAQRMGFVDFTADQRWGGAITTYNDGGSLSGVVVGDIQVLNITGQDGSGYILSRFEGSEENPKWTLFSQDGYVEISKDGIIVWEDNGSASNNVLLASNSQFDLVNIAAKNTCTTGRFTAFKNAIDKKHGGFWKASSGCVAAIAAGGLACYTAPSGVTAPTCLVAVGVISHTCGFPFYDGMNALIHNSPPKISVGEWIPTLSTTWRDWSKDGEVGGDESGEILVSIYRAKITLTDDKKPNPTIVPAYFIQDGYIELAAGSNISVVITDCEGKSIKTSIVAPDPRPEELKTWRPIKKEIVEDEGIKLTEGEWVGKFSWYPFPSDCKGPVLVKNEVNIQIEEGDISGEGSFILDCKGKDSKYSEFQVDIWDFDSETGNGFISESHWRGTIWLEIYTVYSIPQKIECPCEIKTINNKVTVSIVLPDNEKAFISLTKK